MFFFLFCAIFDSSGRSFRSSDDDPNVTDFSGTKLS